MFKEVVVAALGFACLSSNLALAEKNYFGGNIAFVGYSEDGINDEASLTMISGRLGTKFNENLSGEVRVGLGVSDDTIDVFGIGVDVELDNMYGAYLRGGFKADAFYPYVVLGYTQVKVTASVPGYSISQSDSDLSFGLGTDIDLNESLTLNFEYMNYFDTDGVKISGFSLGVASSF